MALARNNAAPLDTGGSVRTGVRSSVTRLRNSLATRVRALPVARHAWARYRRHRYEQRIARFLTEKTGRADRLPMGAVYEATMRCNLHCEFCYVGDLLNIEGEWRQELSLEALARAFPERAGFQISLTGGEIFMRKDIMSVLDLFRSKGYACGYLTTNGTIINEERAEALADLAAAGFLKHISVSIDGPGELHDAARGLKGTFERTCAGLRRLQEAARRKHAPLRVSINTTVAHESLEALDQMVEVAEELGVDAIGLNHLMYSTPEEVTETVRIIGAPDASVIATFVTQDPGLDVAQVKQKVASLEEKCRRRNVLFDYRPKVHQPLLENYYTPGAKLDGRCLYPFLHARVSFSGKVYFCPFIRVEVGDLASSSLEEIWNGERYVEMRRKLVEHSLFPVCRRCCKVELSPEPAVEPFPAGAPARRAIPLTVVR
jgi:Fe-coproporphyrin III synthase